MIKYLLAYDISRVFNWCVNVILGIFKFMFDLLDSIVFNGVSMLDWTITIMILSCLIPLLISFAGYEYRQNQKNEKRSRSRSKKGDEESV